MVWLKITNTVFADLEKYILIILFLITNIVIKNNNLSPFVYRSCLQMLRI